MGWCLKHYNNYTTLKMYITAIQVITVIAAIKSANIEARVTTYQCNASVFSIPVPTEPTATAMILALAVITVMPFLQFNTVQHSQWCLSLSNSSDSVSDNSNANDHYIVIYNDNSWTAHFSIFVDTVITSRGVTAHNFRYIYFNAYPNSVPNIICWHAKITGIHCKNYSVVKIYSCSVAL